jgi:hypothetical protein
MYDWFPAAPDVGSLREAKRICRRAVGKYRAARVTALSGKVLFVCGEPYKRPKEFWE